MNVTAAAAISSTTCAQRFPLVCLLLPRPVLGDLLLSDKSFFSFVPSLSWVQSASSHGESSFTRVCCTLELTSIPFPMHRSLQVSVECVLRPLSLQCFSQSHPRPVGGSDGPTHRTAANLVQEVLTESACLAGLPDDPIEDSRVAISFFNFACVRGRQILWNDMARALEAIKEQRTLMHVRRGAWEYDDDQQSDGEGLPVDASLESGKKDFIPCDKWLPDAHLRYAYCPVPFPLPQARPGPSTTLVSSNTRTYSSYLMRLLLRFEMTKQHCEELYRFALLSCLLQAWQAAECHVLTNAPPCWYATPQTVRILCYCGRPGVTWRI